MTADPNKIKARFGEIYDKAEWTFGANVSKSGHGSTIEYTAEYRAVLEEFLASHADIKSIVDIGCGDWAFSKEVDWKGKHYLGLDVVPPLIEQNTNAFGNDRVKFALGDVTDPAFVVPSAELYILKDVLQHLPNNLINYILGRLIHPPWFRDKIDHEGPARYVLITNCFYQRQSGQDTEVGGFRPLSPYMTPLSEHKPKLLKIFHTKAISLIESKRAPS